MEEEERDSKRDANNVAMDTFFTQSPNITNERRISSNILVEKIKGFNELTIQSTIKDSAYYDSEEDIISLISIL